MRMNIYRARAYTAKNGIIVDKIQVSNWKELAWEGTVQALETRLESAVQASLANDEYEMLIRNIRDTQGYILPPSEVLGRFEPFIEIDNETSGEFSILEFFAGDRLGLLYDATSLIHDRSIDIISARINTESGLAHDIFYVQKEGSKLQGMDVPVLLAMLWERLK